MGVVQIILEADDGRRTRSSGENSSSATLLDVLVFCVVLVGVSSTFRSPMHAKLARPIATSVTATNRSQRKSSTASISYDRLQSLVSRSKSPMYQGLSVDAHPSGIVSAIVAV